MNSRSWPRRRRRSRSSGGRRPQRDGEGQILRRRQRLAPGPHQRCDQLLRAPGLDELSRQRAILLGRIRGKRGQVPPQPLLIERANLLRRGRRRPGHLGACLAQNPLGAALARGGHQQDAHAFSTGASGAPAAVLKDLRVVRQVGVNDEAHLWQVEPARSHIGRHQHPRPPVAQRLQSPRPLRLRQLARERNREKAALGEAGVQMRNAGPSGAEDDRARGIREPQRVHHRVLALSRRDQVRAHLDVLVRLRGRRRGNARRIALVLARQLVDRLRQGRGEEQCAPLFGRVAKDALQLVAKAHVEHFVGLVEHQHAQPVELERLAVEVIAEPARRADHDVRAIAQRPRLARKLPPAHAARHPRARRRIQPAKLDGDLKCQLPRRRDHQRERLRGARQQAGVLGQKLHRHREPECHRLARPCSRRDQQVAPGQLCLQHRGLHRRRLAVSLGRDRAQQRRVRAQPAKARHPSLVRFALDSHSRAISTGRALTVKASKDQPTIALTTKLLLAEVKPSPTPTFSSSGG